jgi:ABC-type nitrate/sulfonate/bicarbonate transport system permease component
MITNDAATFKTAYLFFPIQTLAAFGIVLTELLRWADRRLLPWNKS